MSTSISLPATCRSATADGDICKRHPANGEPYCWQHGKTFRHRWRAISTNKSALFVLAVISVLFGAFEFPNTLNSLLWRHIPPPKQVAVPVSGDPYVVTWDLAQVASDHRTVHGGVWVREGPGGDNDLLFPVNFALFVTIMSRHDFPVLIKNLKIALHTDQDTFVQLDEVGIFDGTDQVYGGYSPDRLSLLTDPAVLLRTAIVGKQIPAHSTISGWLFFQFPKDTGARFDWQMKVTISDYGGFDFTSPVLRPLTGRTAQPFVFGPLTSPTNLSNLKVAFVD